MFIAIAIVKVLFFLPTLIIPLSHGYNNTFGIKLFNRVTEEPINNVNTESAAKTVT